jgi:hypothetical protein
MASTAKRRSLVLFGRYAARPRPSLWRPRETGFVRSRAGGHSCRSFGREPQTLHKDGRHKGRVLFDGSRFLWGAGSNFVARGDRA